MGILTDYHFQVSLILAAFSLSFYWWLAPRFGRVSAAFFCYVAVNTVWFWVWRDNRYVTVNPYDQMAIRYFAADSLLKLLVIVLPLMLYIENVGKDKFRSYGVMVIGPLVVANAMAIILWFISGKCRAVNSCGGFMGNPSLAASLMVCALPIIARYNRWILVPVGIAVALSGSSIALGLMAIYLCFTFIAHGYLVVMAASVAPFLAGFLLLGQKELFFSSGRFEVWRVMMKAWASTRNIPFGSGWGTYHVFSIHLQNRANIGPGTHWNWLHNDWLQILFEGGAVALVLASLTYTAALLRSVGQRGLWLSVLLYGIFMFLNPALHYPLPMIFGAWLFVLALWRDPLQYGNLTA